MGVRLFTFFIYLREPAQGGSTFFPRLNITVRPKAGSALLWPNVLDDDLRTADMRTNHEAQPPIEGLKYSSNLWLHMYDFRGPNTHGCEMDKHVRARKHQHGGEHRGHSTRRDASQGVHAPENADPVGIPSESEHEPGLHDPLEL